MLEQLEELLITADMGVETAMRVTANMAEGRYGRMMSAADIKELLAAEVARVMEPVARPLPLYPKKPQVVLVVGVNGSGKTTTIGKLASQFKAAGKSGGDRRRRHVPRGGGRTACRSGASARACRS
jgi:fused signal recognition particle receptor